MPTIDRSSSLPEKLPEQWFSQDIDAIEHRDQLEGLLCAAREALETEDEALRKAFESQKEVYAKINRGLAYWLFETTLVYLIFKAWIPRGHAQWETPLEDGQRHHMDLCFTPKADGADGAWGFEAKWWMSMRKKYCDGLRHDVARLLESENLRERFLLTFWWTNEACWPKDREQVQSFCDNSQIYGYRKAQLTPFYVGTFQTQVMEPGAPCSFVLAALRITNS